MTSIDGTFIWYLSGPVLGVGVLLYFLLKKRRWISWPWLAAGLLSLVGGELTWWFYPDLWPPFLPPPSPPPRDFLQALLQAAAQGTVYGLDWLLTVVFWQIALILFSLIVGYSWLWVARRSFAGIQRKYPGV